MTNKKRKYKYCRIKDHAVRLFQNHKDNWNVQIFDVTLNRWKTVAYDRTTIIGAKKSVYNILRAALKAPLPNSNNFLIPL